MSCTATVPLDDSQCPGVCTWTTALSLHTDPELERSLPIDVIMQMLRELGKSRVDSARELVLYRDIEHETTWLKLCHDPSREHPLG